MTTPGKPFRNRRAVACNAVGDVIDPANGQVMAGARTPDGRGLHDTQRALLAGERPAVILPGTNTTIGVIATDAVLTKAQAQRLAVAGHDGLARTIRPVHTQLDGDTLFTLGTGAADTPARLPVRLVGQMRKRETFDQR